MLLNISTIIILIELTVQYYVLFLLAEPCIVTAADMRGRNIDFMHKRGQERLYAAHNTRIIFVCTRGRRGGTVSLTQYCSDGQITLPICY